MMKILYEGLKYPRIIALKYMASPLLPTRMLAATVSDQLTIIGNERVMSSASQAQCDRDQLPPSPIADGGEHGCQP
jgi:hypothetical protein